MSDIRLIDANALKEDFVERYRKAEEWITKAKDEEIKIRAEATRDFIGEVIMTIDYAPTVEYPFYAEAYQTGYEEGKNERPQGEREFIEILTNYTPDDLCTYPEYRGKPYYSIHYRENGEEFVGYGTYKIEVLSRYLQDYFISADMRGEKK